jgi:hypothetical protein
MKITLPRQIFLGKTILGKKYQQKNKTFFSLLARLLNCKYKPNGSLSILLHKKSLSSYPE